MSVSGAGASSEPTSQPIAPVDTQPEKETHAKEAERLDKEMSKLVEQRKSLESTHSSRTEDYRTSQLELHNLIEDKTRMWQKIAHDNAKEVARLKEISLSEKAYNCLLTEDITRYLARIKELEDQLSMEKTSTKQRLLDYQNKSDMTSDNLRDKLRQFEVKN